MGQPVKLSDELVDDARAVAPFSQRSIARQIEFWAGLGKSIAPDVNACHPRIVSRIVSLSNTSSGLADGNAHRA
jgi:hypothetical protein